MRFEGLVLRLILIVRFVSGLSVVSRGSGVSDCCQLGKLYIAILHKTNLECIHTPKDIQCEILKCCEHSPNEHNDVSTISKKVGNDDNDQLLEARRANVKFIYIFTSICYTSSAFFLLTLVVYLFLGMYVIYYQKLTLGLLFNSFVGYLSWGLVWQAGPNVHTPACTQLGKLN